MAMRAGVGLATSAVFGQDLGGICDLVDAVAHSSGETTAWMQ